MRKLLMAVMLAASAAVHAATLSGPAEDATAIVDAFHAALHRGDTAGAALLLSEDALIFEGGYVERDKAEYAKHHLPADAAFSKAVASTLVHRTGGGDGDTAWVASEGRTSGSFKGKLVNSMTTETMVLRRSGTSWKIVHIHWSSHSMKGD